MTLIMKLLYFFFIALIAFLNPACKSSNNYLYQFNPRTLVEKKITLSGIADKITYVPLDNSLPLGQIFNIEFINNAIYFTSKDIGILAFDSEGKFARKIGSIGRGPGEYLYCNNFSVAEQTATVYVLDKGNIIKVYSIYGQFIRSFSLQEYGDMIDAIKFHDSKLFVTYALQFGNTKYEWMVFDSLGNVIKKKDREVPMFNANSGGREGISQFENRIYYWNNYADTVFSILPDLSEEPSFIISPGEHRIPKSNLSLEQVQHWNYMEINSIFETTRFHVIRYFYNKPAILLFDKHNQDSFLIYFEYDGKTGDLLSGIENDLDTGPWFIPECYFSENDREYMVGLQYPYQIKTIVSTNEFKNSTPKYPEKKKEFEKLANNLKETDNPVLMIVRLKK
jgi:hypothetical protein